jgi:hypothetical protein
MFNFPGQDIGNSFNAAVGMPGEPFEIIVGVVTAKIVQEEKGIELGHLVIAEGPVEVDPGTLQRGFALPDFGDFSDGGHAVSPFKQKITKNMVGGTHHTLS